MKQSVALLLVALLAGYGIHVLAQGRPEVRMAITPVGSASSNGVAVVWFYDSAERTVYACRTGQGGSDVVECKGKATLP